MLDDALELARRAGRRERGTVVVLPTGRETSSPGSSLHASLSVSLADPASDPRVHCVSPSGRDGGWFLWRDARGRWRPFANRGPCVRWMAPGDDLAYPLEAGPRLIHAESSGASAVAAGAVALVLAANPELESSEVHALLSRTAAPPVDPSFDGTSLADPADLLPSGRDRDGHDAKCGYGRLDATAGTRAASDPFALALIVIGERDAAGRWLASGSRPLFAAPRQVGGEGRPARPRARARFPGARTARPARRRIASKVGGPRPWRPRAATRPRRPQSPRAPRLSRADEGRAGAHALGPADRERCFVRRLGGPRRGLHPALPGALAASRFFRFGERRGGIAWLDGSRRSMKDTRTRSPLLVGIIAPVTVLLLAISASHAVQWYGHSFPGVLITADGSVSSIGLPTWSGLEQGLRFPDRVESIDDVPLQESVGVFPAAAMWTARSTPPSRKAGRRSACESSPAAGSVRSTFASHTSMQPAGGSTPARRCSWPSCTPLPRSWR